MIDRQFGARILRSGSAYVSIPTTVQFAHDPDDDPFAVTMHIKVDDDETVTWAFAVDLLTEGHVSKFPVGEGDVQIRVTRNDVVVIRLESPEGIAQIGMPAWRVREFLKAVGDTNYDAARVSWLLDAAIEEILNA